MYRTYRNTLQRLRNLRTADRFRETNGWYRDIKLVPIL